jgi:hypothetical protein
MPKTQSTPRDHAVQLTRHLQQVLDVLASEPNHSAEYRHYKSGVVYGNLKGWIEEFYDELLTAMDTLPDSPKVPQLDEELNVLRSRLVPVHRSWKLALILARIIANVRELQIPDPNVTIADRVKEIRRWYFGGQEPFKKFNRLRQWLYGRTPAGKASAEKQRLRKSTPEHKAKRAQEKRMKYHGVHDPKHLPPKNARRIKTAWQRIDEDD